MNNQQNKKAPGQGRKNKNTVHKAQKPPASGRSPKNALKSKGSGYSAPVARAQIVRTGIPQMRSQSNGDIVVSHREYIQDIAGSVAFTNNTLSVNPGLPGTFPWLSAISQRYESYLFEQLSFEFETEAPTTATGTVLLTLDYDASDPAPVDKTQALSYRRAVRSAPWLDCRHISLSEDLHKRKTYNVRSGSLSANQDIKLYDTATLYVSTIGQAGTTNIGELYVCYTVRLMTPQMGDARLGEAVSGRFTGVSNAAPFGAVAASGNLPVTISSAGATPSVVTFTFTQPWSGYASVALSGTGQVSVAPSGTATANLQSNVVNAGSTAQSALILVDADLSQTLILTTVNTTISGGDVFFGQSQGNP